MGAVGLNGAARAEGGMWAAGVRVASTGRATWTPVSGAAIDAHLCGSGGLLAANAPRVAAQRGVAAATVAKTVVTGAALAATAYTGALGKKITLTASTDPRDAEKAAEDPIDSGTAQRHLAGRPVGGARPHRLPGRPQRPARRAAAPRRAGGRHVAAGPLDDAGAAGRHRPAPDGLTSLTNTRTAFKRSVMDKNALIEATVRKTAETGEELSPAEVERVVDALFGTVTVPGAIADGLRRGEIVTVLGFGDFHVEGAQPRLRPGQALNEYVKGEVR
ncbi:DNA-binding protein OS=Streptomyces fumanus OX=67302 GN=GCM10018772_69690 PE=4 SV=1 [Streptomyces fumanus]